VVWSDELLPIKPGIRKGIESFFEAVERNISAIVDWNPERN